MPSIDRTEAWRRSRKRCHYCNIRLTPGTATRDHIIPRSAGGPDHQATNIVISCLPCNRYKASMPVQEFLRSGWLLSRRTRVSSGTIQAAPVVRKTDEERQERIRIGLE